MRRTSCLLALALTAVILFAAACARPGDGPNRPVPPAAEPGAPSGQPAPPTQSPPSQPPPQMTPPEPQSGEPASPEQSGAAPAPPGDGTLPEGPAALLLDGPGAIRPLSFRRGEAVEAPHGIFWLSLADGSVRGWTIEGALPWEVRYGASPDDRLIVARDNAHQYLVSVPAMKAVRWAKNRPRLVAAEYLSTLQPAAGYGRILFLYPDSGDFVITDEELRVLSRFRLTSEDRQGDPQALFSPDGNWLLLAARRAEGARLIRVSVRTGDVDRIAEVPERQGDRRLSALTVEAERSGDRVFTRASYAGPDGIHTVLRRYGWDGTALGSLTVPSHSVQVAPTGGLVAYEHALLPYVPAVTVVEFESGNPLLRVRHGTLCYAMNGEAGGSRWLGTGDRLVVRTGKGYTQLRMDGSLPEVAVWSSHPGEPFPSPGQRGLYAMAVWDILRVVDGAGTVQAAVQARAGIMAQLDLWGGTGSAVRFQTPHFGRGVQCLLPPLSPVVELPPFAERVTLRLREGEVSLDLRPEPSASAPLLQQLTPGSDVTVACVRSGLPGVWAQVRTRLGDEGWLLLWEPEWIDPHPASC